MKVILAEAMGMCFGVRDAIRSIEQVSDPEQVTIYGELVHNEAVLRQLESRGFHQANEATRVAQPPTTPTVLITAHGISHKQRQQLLEAGKQLIDTTCPLVGRVHSAARELAQEGFHVLVIGKPGHVEVEGIVQDLASVDVVNSAAEVRDYGQARLGIICQTTASPTRVAEICAEIQLHNPLAEIRFIDTVCEPTRRRQQAMHALVEQVEIVVVVGGKNSNNTLALVDFCHQRGVPVLHVQGPADLEPIALKGCETVGLTAGTSTLPETIAAVHQALLALGPGATRSK